MMITKMFGFVGCFRNETQYDADFAGRLRLKFKAVPTLKGQECKP